MNGQKQMKNLKWRPAKNHISYESGGNNTEWRWDGDRGKLRSHKIFKDKRKSDMAALWLIYHFVVPLIHFRVS